MLELDPISMCVASLALTLACGIYNAKQERRDRELFRSTMEELRRIRRFERQQEEEERTDDGH